MHPSCRPKKFIKTTKTPVPIQGSVSSFLVRGIFCIWFVCKFFPPYFLNFQSGLVCMACYVSHPQEHLAASCCQLLRLNIMYFISIPPLAGHIFNAFKWWERFIRIMKRFHNFIIRKCIDATMFVIGCSFTVYQSQMSLYWIVQSLFRQ